MRLVQVVAAAAAILAAVSLAAPAFAGFGALAFDTTNGRFGYSFNEPNLQAAKDLALKGCNSPNCKIIAPVDPRMCGAIAIGKESWGISAKPTRDAAELAAMQDCQKHTSGQCKVRHSECNR